jgi:hypothetical protein
MRLPPARASSHPDFNRRSRNSTGSASRWRCHAFGRVADCHRRLGISPTPEHAFTTGTSVPCRLFRRETAPGPPRPGPRLERPLVVAAGRSAGPSLSRSPAARPLPPGPGCASGEDQRQEDQYNWQAALYFVGIPPDQKDGGAADRDADRDTFQQRAAAPRLRRRCPERACQARVNACGYLLVNLLKERCHHRVAVLGAKLTVRLGSRANLLWGQRRSTHMGRLNPGEVAGQEGQRRRFLGGEERGTVAAMRDVHHGTRQRSGERVRSGAERVAEPACLPNRGRGQRGGVGDDVGRGEGARRSCSPPPGGAHGRRSCPRQQAREPRRSWAASPLSTPRPAGRGPAGPAVLRGKPGRARPSRRQPAPRVRLRWRPAPDGASIRRGGPCSPHSPGTALRPGS